MCAEKTFDDSNAFDLHYLLRVSMESFIKKRITRTGRFCPMRWTCRRKKVSVESDLCTAHKKVSFHSICFTLTLSIAWHSLAEFHHGSMRNTTFPRVRLIPVPQAMSEQRMNRGVRIESHCCVSKASMASIRSCICIVPSIRVKVCPSRRSSTSMISRSDLQEQKQRDE